MSDDIDDLVGSLLSGSLVDNAAESRLVDSVVLDRLLNELHYDGDIFHYDDDVMICV